MEKEIRRYQNTLIIIGTGVIAFGIWSVCRTLISVFINRDDITAMVIEGETGLTSLAVLITFYVFMLIYLVLDLALRFFVGFSARQEGKGVKKGKAYLIAAAFIIAGSVINLVISVSLFAGGDTSLIEFLVTLIVEFTSAVTVFEMIAASVKLRKITNMAKSEGLKNAA